MKKTIFLFILLIARVGAVSAGVLQPVEILPDSKWDDECKVSIKFDIPVHVIQKATINIKVHGGSAYTGTLILSPEDATGKTVVARFSHWGNELDYFKEWEGGRSYTFTVEAGQIFAKGDSDLNNEKIEWTIDRRLPAGVCNMAGEKIGELNVGDLVFEWQGEENAIQASQSGGPGLLVRMIHEISGYKMPTCSRGYKCRIESDTINHIYRVIPMTDENIPHDPYVLNLLENVTYELEIYGVSSKKNRNITSDYSDNPVSIEGLTPYDSDDFDVYPGSGFFTTRNYPNEEGFYLEDIWIPFNTDFTSIMTWALPYNIYVDGEIRSIRTVFDGSHKWFKSLYGLGTTVIEYNANSVYEFELPSGLITSPTGQMYYMKTTRVPLNIELGISSTSSEDKRESPVYDLYGRKVEKPVPGNIYIRGGKKFVMR